MIDLNSTYLGFATAALLVVSGLALAAETALLAAAAGKLRLGAGDGPTPAKSLVTHVDANADALRATRLLALMMGLCALTSALFTPDLTALNMAWTASGILLIALADGLIRALAQYHAASILRSGMLTVKILIAVGKPFAALIRMIDSKFLRLVGVDPMRERHQTALRDDIAGAIALGHSGGAMEKADRDRLLGALDLSDRTVEEIMRHRRQIEMINADDAPAAIISQMLASPHSRLPVFRGDEENIVGVVHTKELLREVDRLVRVSSAVGANGITELDIVKVAMKPYFIPNTTALDEQMRAFLERRTHFALVVDEYGSLLGLITLEDILEEIVGDITDEFDVVSRNSGLKPSESGDFLVDGAMTIRDLNRAMDWHLPDTEANTIAGLVIHEAQMIPSEGQVFSFHGFRFEVAQRQENRLSKLKLRALQAQ